MPASSRSPARGWTAKAFIAFCGFAAIAAFLLFSEHRAHLLGFLPWALLLLCPVLHLFMHGGHQGHGDNMPNGDHGDGNASNSRSPDLGTERFRHG